MNYGNNINYDTITKQKIEDTREAKNELIMLNAVKELLKDNDLACEVTINGITIGLCSNLSVLPAIKKNITEINKFLKGEPNEWE